MTHYLYRLTDPETDQYYIGSRTCEGSWKDDDYMGSYVSWEPEDESRLVKDVLGIFPDRDETNEFEKILIEGFIDDPLNENYYIPDVGFCLQGKEFSKEHREKIGKAHRGKVVSPETRRKLSEWRKGRFVGKDSPMYGRTFTEEHRQKLSEAFSNRTLTEEWKRKIGEASKGRTHTEETKEKIRQANLGRKHTPETRRKMSKAKKGKYVGKNNHNYGKTFSKERKDKIAKTKSKSVEHIESGKQFECGKDAAEYFGIGASTVSRHCRNEMKKQKFRFI